MSWSTDGTQWWDGVAWRLVGPDGRHYSDGVQWIPIPGTLTPPPMLVGHPTSAPGWAWNGYTWVPDLAMPRTDQRSRRPPDFAAAGLVALGAVLTAIGAFLPWVTAETYGFSLGKSGIDGGDGWITTAAAAIAIIPAWRLWTGSARVWARVVLALAAAVIGAVAGYDWSDTNRRLSDINPSSLVVGKVGTGIYLSVVGGALIFIAVAVSLRRTAPTGTSAQVAGRFA